jgi:hypothetical protein
MIRANASSQFVDSEAFRGCISWFSRRELGLANGFTTNRAFTNSSTLDEVHTEIRVSALNWANETVRLHSNGHVRTDTINGTAVIGIGNADTTTGSAMATASVQAANANTGDAYGLSGWQAPGEGFHFYTLLGITAAGQTATFLATLAGGNPGELKGFIDG